MEDEKWTPAVQLHTSDEVKLDDISVQIPPTLAQLILSAVHHATLPIEELLASLEARVAASVPAEQARRPIS